MTTAKKEESKVAEKPTDPPADKAYTKEEYEAAHARIKELEEQLAEPTPEAPADLATAVDQLNEQIDEVGDDGVEWTQVKDALKAATDRALYLQKRDSDRKDQE